MTVEIRIAVCGSASEFDDDLEGECYSCGERIYFRPHVESIRVKVCPGCGQRMMYRKGTPENVEIPPESLTEVMIKKSFRP